MHHPTDRIAHTMAFVTPVVEHWLEREIAQLIIIKSRLVYITSSVKGSKNIFFFKYIFVSGILIKYAKMLKSRQYFTSQFVSRCTAVTVLNKD